MTTAAQHQKPQQSHPQFGFVVADTYDPDEVVPRGSPLMTPLRPRLAPSPSPPPDIPPAQVSLSPVSLDERDKSNRHKVRPNSGDAILVAYLDNGRDPEIARVAARQVLPCDEDSLDDESSLDGPAGEVVMTVPSLQHLAADALQAAFATGPATLPSPASISALALKGTSDISISTRHLSIRDDLPAVAPLAVSYPFSGADVKPVTKPPPAAVLTNVSGELPPLQMDSPRSESNGQMLPSIRSTLGDFNRLPPEPMATVEKDLASRHRPSPNFPGSPPGGIPRFPPIATTHASPPISPNEGYTRNLPSPHSLSASSPYYYNTNGIHQRSNAEYSSSTTAETPSTDHSASTPATSTSVADRMSIDGITNPQVGAYVCTFIGCTAPAFQTQYLLNSHANVHSSARPHYCSVQGCPRSEGGKGFKRKNEMIRHGLVHDSPGYVCPFCPDREHKYPRPDNLQRHVRVHHVDKDKDDPLLRDVLSQRPDGPNRGRRRRGPPA
ncbi:C2H2 type zinc finger domain-containing protein [Dactylonectria macrodidyma]|uniref:C2H2 type zinc finger domain-containing protein n=1 Tax=Dactylonectria macrodidyma TaxID=307937 RepID=A0A9P9DWD6_9HYPO|nr:C2H2 type zinc finger domain-containing protein [Dactylonectria macrodidyma]